MTVINFYPIIFKYFAARSFFFLLLKGIKRPQSEACETYYISETDNQWCQEFLLFQLRIKFQNLLSTLKRSNKSEGKGTVSCVHDPENSLLARISTAEGLIVDQDLA